MRIVRFAALSPAAWKNGGGTTVEIAAHPPGATLDNFDWRVSAAEVRESSRFSCFEGVDRTLAILDGAGLLIDFGDGATKVEPEGPPIVFRGETPIIGRPLAGLTRDLNVMTRRCAWRADMERRTITAGVPVLIPGDTRIVVALSRCVIRCGAQSAALDCYDALILDAQDESTFDAGTSTSVITISLQRVDPD